MTQVEIFCVGKKLLTNRGLVAQDGCVIILSGRRCAMKGTKIYYFYFILSQVIWGVLPAFWLLLRELPPLYTLSSRIIWASVLCFFLILQKHLLPGLKALPRNVGSGRILPAPVSLLLLIGVLTFMRRRGASFCKQVWPILSIPSSSYSLEASSFGRNCGPYRGFPLSWQPWIGLAFFILRRRSLAVLYHLPDLGDVQHD